MNLSYCIILVDLCLTESISCHENASCAATQFDFICACNEGTVGNGTHCEGNSRRKNFSSSLYLE